MSDQDFLNELTVMVRAYGWSGDHTEVERFARWCWNRKTGNNPPDDHFEPPEGEGY